MNEFTLSAFADEIDESLELQMDTLELHGISNIEMRGVDGKNITQYTLDEVKEIKKKLDKKGFKISALGSPVGKIMITDEFAPHLELFKHTLEIAKTLQTKYIRMFSFFIPQGHNADDYKDEVVRRWSEFVKLAEGTGIILLHENEKDIYGDTPERCVELFKALDTDIVKATFDPANFVQCNISPFPEAYNVLKDYLEYLHIKDATMDSHKVVPAGFGDGKIKEILIELKSQGYNGFVSLEPHLGAFKGLAALELEIDTSDMPESGPGLFEVAVNALKNIISEI